MKVIYDLGAHNGNDLPYYLDKADLVVAVEANPELVSIIRNKFPKEISSGRLRVENRVVTGSPNSRGEETLYLNTRNSVLSSLIPPENQSSEWHLVQIPAVSILELVEENGNPWFIKIDLEGYDTAILRALFSSGIFPNFLSCEGHDPAVFGLLHGWAQYRSFKVVFGGEVGGKLAKVKYVSRNSELHMYEFPPHSAGPFGEDIPGPWFSSDDFWRFLRVRGTGWYDIHASFLEPTARVPLTVFKKGFLLEFLRICLPRFTSVMGHVRKASGLRGFTSTLRRTWLPAKRQSRSSSHTVR